MNLEAFYSLIRPMYEKLSSSQVEGIEAVLNEWERRQLSDLRFLAYILATIFHETARTMQPIAEFGKGKGRQYGVPDPVTGHAYYGRGLVQVTWLNNYRSLTKANEEGWDFVKEPDLLLRMAPSVWATFHGMTTGIFTGKKLSDYFNEMTDWVNARKIINGLDKAKLIGEYGKAFYLALLSSESLGDKVGKMAG